MITGGLFETTQSFGVGNTANQYTEEMANRPSSDSPYPDSYWLGYINSEDLPRFMHRSKAVPDYDNDTLRFVRLDEKQNCPCGYINLNNSSVSTTDIYRDDEFLNPFVNVPLFINNLHPEYSGYYSISNITLSFAIFLYDGGDNLVNYFYSNAGNLPYLQFSISLLSLYSFLYDGAEIQSNYSYGGLSFSISLKATDIEKGTAYIELENGYHARIFLLSFNIPNTYFQNGASASQKYIRFISKISYSDDERNSFYVRSLGNFNYTVSTLRGQTATNFNLSTLVNITNGDNFYYYLGGEFNLTQLTTYSSTGPLYMYNDETLAYYASYSGYGNLGRNFRIILYLDDIRKSLSLMYRVCLVGTGINYTSYIKNFTYATDVDPDGRFRARLKTGNITDENFKNSLRPWQYEDFQAEEFEEDDIPEYEPDEPDEPDDIPPEPDELPDTSGESSDPQKDRVVPSPSKFITQYILNASDVSAIGELLWSGWLDEDTSIWKNFLFKVNLLQDSGTFNITAALDYIISLRVFPYDIPAYTLGHLGSSDGVYMGTGHTKFLDKNVPILSSLCGAVYAGGIDVTPKDGERYKDFRDYYNTSVAVYFPYCGTVELNPVEVMYKHLECTYFVDYQSGACTAILEMNDNGVNYIIASKSGQIGFLLPVTATNAGQLSSQFIADATSVASTLYGFYSRNEQISYKLAGVMAGASAASSKGSSTDQFDMQAASLKQDFSDNVFNTGTSLVNQANNVLNRSGINIPMLSGGAGIEAFMMPKTPMLMIRRGKYSVPKNYAHSMGYRFTESGRIGDIKGYAEFVNVDVSGINCHEDEKTEIKQLLESGVFV